MSTFVPCSLFHQRPMLKENSLLLVNQQIRFEFKQPCQDFFTSPCTIYRPLHFFGFSRHFPIRRTCLSFTKNEFNNYLCDCDLDKVIVVNANWTRDSQRTSVKNPNCLYIWDFGYCSKVALNEFRFQEALFSCSFNSEKLNRVEEQQQK